MSLRGSASIDFVRLLGSVPSIRARQAISLPKFTRVPELVVEDWY